jgi:hypothetical protein
LRVVRARRTAMSDEPNGCGWCGRDQRSHGIEWLESVGYHNWTEPTDAQRRERMTQNRANKHELLIEVDAEAEGIKRAEALRGIETS